MPRPIGNQSVHLSKIASSSKNPLFCGIGPIRGLLHGWK